MRFKDRSITGCHWNANACIWTIKLQRACRVTSLQFRLKTWNPLEQREMSGTSAFYPVDIIDSLSNTLYQNMLVTHLQLLCRPAQRQ